MIHPTATISAGASLGHDVSIGPYSVVGEDAVVGDQCVIGSGVSLCCKGVLESGVTVGSNAVFVPGLGSSTTGGTLVKRMAHIGANATIYPNVIIGARAEVCPGAVVTRSVPANAIVEGNPANIVGYVDTVHRTNYTHIGLGDGRSAAIESTAVKGVTLHSFSVIPDLRGNLTVGEFGRQIPFAPQRYFVVYGVPSREVRGEHAHRVCHQFLICLRGSCAVVADDGENRVEVLLDVPSRGLYLPPMTWGVQYQYSADAMLLVFASHHYDANDYIREYEQFLDASLGTPL
jgi:acetyltransferase-like isoleucine patch superfamily enzyme